MFVVECYQLIQRKETGWKNGGWEGRKSIYSRFNQPYSVQLKPVGRAYWPQGHICFTFDKYSNSDFWSKAFIHWQSLLPWISPIPTFPTLTLKDRQPCTAAGLLKCCTSIFKRSKVKWFQLLWVLSKKTNKQKNHRSPQKKINPNDYKPSSC